MYDYRMRLWSGQVSNLAAEEEIQFHEISAPSSVSDSSHSSLPNIIYIKPKSPKAGQPQQVDKAIENSVS